MATNLTPRTFAVSLHNKSQTDKGKLAITVQIASADGGKAVKLASFVLPVSRPIDPDKETCSILRSLGNIPFKVTLPPVNGVVGENGLQLVAQFSPVMLGSDLADVLDEARGIKADSAAPAETVTA